MITNDRKYSEDEFLDNFSAFIEDAMDSFGQHDIDLSDLRSKILVSTEAIPQDVNVIPLEVVSGFIKGLNKSNFNRGLVPYARITEIIFKNVGDDFKDHIISELKTLGDQCFPKRELKQENEKIPDEERTYYKIVRHIELAIVQKTQLYTENRKNLELLQTEQKKLEKENTRLHESNRRLQHLNEELEEKISYISAEAQSTYKNLITQFITILGIFSAILMGAFGSIQIFTSIFNNAHKLSIGKILIISSLGASAVILILFFLLHSIGKLINKRLDAVVDNSPSFLLKFPFLFISHGIFILVALIGTATELSNIPIKLSLSGIWWGLPAVWLIIMFLVLKSNDIHLFFSKKRKQVHSNQTENSVGGFPAS